MWPQWFMLSFMIAYAVSSVVRIGRDPDWHAKPWVMAIASALLFGFHALIAWALISGGFFAVWLR